jgi:hypothetical protein
MLNGGNYTEVEKPVFVEKCKAVYLTSPRPPDELQINHLFMSLTPQSIYFPFLQYWKLVPPEITASFTNVNCSSNVAVAAFERHPPQERVAGLRCILRKSGSIKTEFGIARDERQGRGARAELLRAFLHPAR